MEQWLNNVLKKLHIEDVPKVRKVIVGVVGWFVIAVGVVLIFIPGPAIVVIPAGFAILAMEYDWAKKWVHKACVLLKEWKAKVKNFFTRHRHSEEHSGSR